MRMALVLSWPFVRIPAHVQSWVCPHLTLAGNIMLLQNKMTFHEDIAVALQDELLAEITQLLITRPPSSLVPLLTRVSRPHIS